VAATKLAAVCQHPDQAGGSSTEQAVLLPAGRGDDGGQQEEVSPQKPAPGRICGRFPGKGGLRADGDVPARRVGDAVKRPQPVTLSPIKLEAERDPQRGQRIIYLTFLLHCPSPALWATIPSPSPGACRTGPEHSQRDG